MSDYLQIIDINSRVEDEIDIHLFYNLYTSELILTTNKLPYPWNSFPINLSSEVLVRIHHLTFYIISLHNYFIL